MTQALVLHRGDLRGQAEVSDSDHPIRDELQGNSTQSLSEPREGRNPGLTESGAVGRKRGRRGRGGGGICSGLGDVAK